MERLIERFMYHCGLLIGYMYVNGLSANVDVMVNDIKHIQNLLDAEEQGLLLRLPCKVGDTVYCLIYEDYIWGIEPYIVRTFEYVLFLVKNEYIGRLVFLSKEEAEKKLAEIKLAEMKGEKT